MSVTTGPLLAGGTAVTGRIWRSARASRPFGGQAPTAALYYASRDRKHEHPAQHLQAFTGILQADAYSGYNELYDPSRSQGAITAALCWAHVVTSRRESKRAKAYRDWSHLALQKPATSRPVDGRYGGHRSSRKAPSAPPVRPHKSRVIVPTMASYLPSTGRLVAGFLTAKCHHLVGCQRA